MSTQAVITVSMAACAAVLSLVLLVGTIRGVNLREMIHRCFFAMLLFNLAGSCCEFVLPFLFGMPGNSVTLLIHTIDFLSYAFGCMEFISFVLYIYEFLSMRGSVSKRPFVIMAGIYASNLLIILTAEFIPVFYQLDESNHYHASESIWVLMVIPSISAAMAFAQILKGIKTCKWQEWISLLLYLMIPFFLYIVESVFPGVWITYMGCTITLLLIYMNIQVTLSHKIKEQELEMIESRFAVMLSQIQPHFLCNSLLAIHDLNKRDHAAASDAILSFAEYLRRNMDLLYVKEIIPFEDELHHVETYLALEKLRFEENLIVDFDIGARRFRLPALTLQPIVENAVRHGVTKREEGGTVTVSTQETDDTYVISVADDGVGFDIASPMRDGRSHMGIANTRSRLAAMCGGSLEIRSEPGAGTHAIITIPKGATWHEHHHRRR